MKTKLLLSLIVFTAVALNGCLPSEVQLTKLTDKQLEQRAEEYRIRALESKLKSVQANLELLRRDKELVKRLFGVMPLSWPIL